MTFCLRAGLFPIARTPSFKHDTSSLDHRHAIEATVRQGDLTIVGGSIPCSPPEAPLIMKARCDLKH